MMTNRKDVIIAVLGTFCLTVTLFMVMPTRSQSGSYDPWIDVNDDGSIDMADISIEIDNFMAAGTPIDKTALLLELQARMDSLNASLLDLEASLETRITTLNASVAALESDVTTLQTTIAALESRIAALEAPGSVTTEKIADGAVTNTKLASDAIPVFYMADTSGVQTTSNTFVDLPGASLSITLGRRSNLLVLLQIGANDNDINQMIVIRCLIDGSPVGYADLCYGSTDWGEYSYTHYWLMPSVSAGIYTLKIQWLVTGVSVGYSVGRFLTVIAFPA